MRKLFEIVPNHIIITFLKECAKESPPPPFVVAIDFGTANASLAYSSKAEFEKNPTNITTMSWEGGTVPSKKAPMSVLLERKGDSLVVHSFGFQAENHYAKLGEKYKKQNYYFFKRFKMELYEKKLDRAFKLKDITGQKSVPAMTVFALSIAYLKRQVQETVKGKCPEDDIMWVITVPSLWSDSAKQFMREAAIQAGIDANNLIIALEPETALLYCKHFHLEQRGSSSWRQLTSGNKYIIVDAGGGTVDVSAHELADDGSLKELIKATGDGLGGDGVDEAFVKFVQNVVGEAALTTFRQDHIADYNEMLRTFEDTKKKIEPNSKEPMILHLPQSLMTLCTRTRGENLERSLARASQAGVTVAGAQLQVSAVILRSLFENASAKIVRHLEEVLRAEIFRSGRILLVGGFSSSRMLTSAVEKAFPNFTVTSPPDANFAALKGAVIYGHNPKLVAERVCKFTYGTNKYVPFEEGIHPTNKKIFVGGAKKCKDTFDAFVKAGQTVKLWEPQHETTYVPVQENAKVMTFPIYKSKERDPEFVDEPDCEKIGELSLNLEKASVEGKRRVNARMFFGGTEIQVEVRDEATGKTEMARINFLG